MKYETACFYKIFTFYFLLFTWLLFLIFAKILIKMSNKPITEFIEKYYLHFNAAALVDAAKGYVAHLKMVGK